MNDDRSVKLYHGISQIREELIREAEEARPRRRRAPWKTWAAAAACLCLTAVGALTWFLGGGESRPVLQWSPGFAPEDYFRYGKGLSGESSSGDVSLAGTPWAESRSFTGRQSLLEAEGVIPIVEDHPVFTCDAYYNEDGSLYCVAFSWYRRGELDQYSDLTVMAGPEAVEVIQDCIAVEVDEEGNIVPPAVTVTQRDGVDVVAEGREDREKTITYQSADGWYQISGSWNDSYSSVVALLDWFWDHPVPFHRFPQTEGDLYEVVDLSDCPEAFAGSLPDFSAFGFLEEAVCVTLKNGRPVSLEGHYVAHVEDEALVRESSYYDVKGYTAVHWCVESEPDVYDLAACQGDLQDLTEAQVLSALEDSGRISFRSGELVLTVYVSCPHNPAGPAETWALIQSVQEAAS